MRLLAIPGTAHPQSGHDLDQVVPRIVCRVRRKRDEGHRNRCGEGSARNAGQNLGHDAAGFECPKQRRQTGKIGEGIPEYAESKGSGIYFVETTGKSRDLVGAAAHEQRRIVDQVGDNADAVAFEISGEVGRDEQHDRSSDRAERIEAADRQESGVARTETRNANQHATVFGGINATPPCGLYFVLVGAAEAAAGALAAGAAGIGVAKSPANCGSFTTIVAFC